MKKTTILIDMYGVILEESKGFFIPYTFNAFDQSEYDRLLATGYRFEAACH